MDINNFSSRSGNLVRNNGDEFNIADNQAALYGQGVVDEINDTSAHVPSDGDYWQKIEVLGNTVFSVLSQGNFYVNGVAAPDRAISQGTVAATGTLTVAVNPTAADTMTIGSTEYTFVAEEDFDAAGEIAIGTDLAATQVNIIAAIMGTDEVNTAHTLVTIGAFAANVATITAINKGTGGNSIATTETFTSGSNVFSAATLEDGTNGTVAAGTLYGKFTGLKLISGSVRAYA